MVNLGTRRRHVSQSVLTGPGHALSLKTRRHLADVMQSRQYDASPHADCLDQPRRALGRDHTSDDPCRAAMLLNRYAGPTGHRGLRPAVLMLHMRVSRPNRLATRQRHTYSRSVSAIPGFHRPASPRPLLDALCSQRLDAAAAGALCSPSTPLLQQINVILSRPQSFWSHHFVVHAHILPRGVGQIASYSRLFLALGLDLKMTRRQKARGRVAPPPRSYL